VSARRAATHVDDTVQDQVQDQVQVQARGRGSQRNAKPATRPLLPPAIAARAPGPGPGPGPGPCRETWTAPVNPRAEPPYRCGEAGRPGAPKSGVLGAGRGMDDGSVSEGVYTSRSSLTRSRSTWPM